jgi:peptidoglycan hydrolase-like amidase
MKQKRNTMKRFLCLVFAAALFSLADFSSPAKADDTTGSDVSETLANYDYYTKYQLYEKYEKKEKYSKYKKYSKCKSKNGFKSPKARALAKEAYKKYKLYLKNKKKYPQYAQYSGLYKKYKKSQCSDYSKYSKYKKYKKYDKSEYDDYENYGTSAYKNGYDKYVAYLNSNNLGEADLPAGVNGPDITVGLLSYSKSDLQDSCSDSPCYFHINASKNYVIKNSSGTTLGTIDKDTETKVKYISSGNYDVYNSISDTTVSGEVNFEAADGDNSDMIFDINKPGSSYDNYRGKIKLKYYNNPDGLDENWAINTLPLEQYLWGIGEIQATGPSDHNNVMVTMFRTYGYWKLKFSTKYIAKGFVVTADTSSQLYYGYDWETAHPNIKTAADDTFGKIVMYGNEIALTPYSSWTDGRTRSFEERWDSTDYPWCQSVSDPYGKHATMSTAELEAAGNHMVGLSAHGSLNLAGDDYNWDWQDIINYYFTGVRLQTAYQAPK